MVKVINKKYFSSFFQSIVLSFKESASPKMIKTFGLFGLLNFPLLFLVGAFLLNEKPTAVYLRLSGFIVCLTLVLINYWPQKLRRFKLLYWFVAITYCLPFFSTYMFIENEGSIAWQVKMTVGIFWLVLVTNWVQALLILPLGMMLAILAFSILSRPLQWQTSSVVGDLVNYIWVIVIASIFARRNEITQQEKQKALKSMAAAIAHEMRTPLSSITNISIGLKKHIPTLIRSQHNAQQLDHPIEIIPENQLKMLQEIPHDLQEVARSAFIVIDMLLMNLQEAPMDGTLEKCSISKCIKMALREYSLTPKEKNLISVGIENDFYFEGNSHLLKHVIFNLLKNSLHYIKVARKGKIVIWSERGKIVNKLCFKDTGKGIDQEILPHIFDQFYSHTKYGAGVGLAFCKMVMHKIGGDIICESVAGEFTQFSLIFPVID